MLNEFQAIHLQIFSISDLLSRTKKKYNLKETEEGGRRGRRRGGEGGGGGGTEERDPTLGNTRNL